MTTRSDVSVKALADGDVSRFLTCGPWLTRFEVAQSRFPAKFAGSKCQ